MPPRLLLLPALALIALRVFGGGGLTGPGTATALLLAALVLLVFSVKEPEASLRVYPVLMSLTAAAAFGLSLVGGPSLIERFARRRDPNLPPRGVRYTWWVTLVWCVFLSINAVVALATVLWGTLAQWTLWNGLLFYIAAGLLMAGELTVRRYLVR